MIQQIQPTQENELILSQFLNLQIRKIQEAKRDQAQRIIDEVLDE